MEDSLAYGVCTVRSNLWRYCFAAKRSASTSHDLIRTSRNLQRILINGFRPLSWSIRPITRKSLKRLMCSSHRRCNFLFIPGSERLCTCLGIGAASCVNLYLQWSTVLISPLCFSSCTPISARNILTVSELRFGIGDPDFCLSR